MPDFLDTFRYEVMGYVYYLFPNGYKTKHGWHVSFADMYSTTGIYVGVWNRRDMPLRLMRDLEKHLKWIEIFGGKTLDDTENSE